VRREAAAPGGPTCSGPGRAFLAKAAWRIMTATGTPYDEFQAKADREIPVVILEPA
jgi:hypothetical protein